MMKAILLALAAGVGSVVGVLVFLVIDFPVHAPYAVDEFGVWTEYGSLILGAVGAISGVVVCWAACVWMNKARVGMSVPNRERDRSIA